MEWIHLSWPCSALPFSSCIHKQTKTTRVYQEQTGLWSKENRLNQHETRPLVLFNDIIKHKLNQILCSSNIRCSSCTYTRPSSRSARDELLPQIYMQRKLNCCSVEITSFACRSSLWNEEIKGLLTNLCGQVRSMLHNCFEKVCFAWSQTWNLISHMSCKCKELL